MTLLRTFWDTAVALDRADTTVRRGSVDAPLPAREPAGPVGVGRPARTSETGELTPSVRYSGFDELWAPFTTGVAPSGAYTLSLDEPRQGSPPGGVPPTPGSSRGPVHVVRPGLGRGRPALTGGRPFGRLGGWPGRRTPRRSVGRVAVVAGTTRGAGRGIAAALGEVGATVYCTGRTSRDRVVAVRLRPFRDHRGHRRPRRPSSAAPGSQSRSTTSTRPRSQGLAERIRRDHGHLRRARQRHLGRRGAQGRPRRLEHPHLGARPRQGTAHPPAGGRDAPGHVPPPSSPCSSTAPAGWWWR